MNTHRFRTSGSGHDAIALCFRPPASDGARRRRGQVALSKQLYEFVDGKIQAMDRSMRAFDNELTRTRQQLNLPAQEGSTDPYAPSVGVATGWGPLLQEV